MGVYIFAAAGTGFLLPKRGTAGQDYRAYFGLGNPGGDGGCLSVGCSGDLGLENCN